MTPLPPGLADLADAERERLSRELAEKADAAFAQSGLIEKSFRLHGRCFVMRFAGKALATAMSRALAHLAIEQSEDVTLTIDCWDVAGSGVACPMPDWPANYFVGRGEIHGLDSPRMRIAWFDWLRLLNVYFPERGRAYYVLESSAPFPIQQAGSPALTIFSWWLQTFGWQFIHAAIVGIEQGSVLIAGHGGAGKSTLAFSTLGSPLRYLCDDYGVLASGSTTQAVAIYNSGKLTETSLALLPHLRCRAANGDDPRREKALFFLHEQFPGEQLLQAPLRAVVISDLNHGETSLTLLKPHAALAIITGSTVRQIAGSSPADLLRLARLTQGLPVYRLRHGSDMVATHRLLLDLCVS